MNDKRDNVGAVDQLASMPNLADALEGDQFRQFLDYVPFAVAVAKLQDGESIVYVNGEFERLTGLHGAHVYGKPWSVLPADAKAVGDGSQLSEAVVSSEDYIDTFKLSDGADAPIVDVWSNTILNDDGFPTFRLVAFAELVERVESGDDDARSKLHEKDTLLRELQHRVKNNLQMITALIRLESRNLQDRSNVVHFERLAGRVNALAVLYRSLSDNCDEQTVDLGVYLSQIASAVMTAHAVEGIRLDMKVDTWPVSVDVAMPTGLVVNELLTNSLKHAFVGREGGEITLRGLVDETGCRVTVADNGIGLEPGVEWPKRGKLSAMIVQSLKQNAKASIEVHTAPGEGVRVSLFFARSEAAPVAE